jgi:hypothetical protein
MSTRETFTTQAADTVDMTIFYHRLELDRALMEGIEPAYCGTRLSVQAFVERTLSQQCYAPIAVVSDPTTPDQWIAGRWRGDLPMSAYRQSLGQTLTIPWDQAAQCIQVFCVTGSFLYAQAR